MKASCPEEYHATWWVFRPNFIKTKEGKYIPDPIGVVVISVEVMDRDHGTERQLDLRRGIFQSEPMQPSQLSWGLVEAVIYKARAYFHEHWDTMTKLTEMPEPIYLYDLIPFPSGEPEPWQLTDRQQALETLQDLAKPNHHQSIDERHARADGVLLNMLRSIGYGDICKAWSAVPKKYD